jgi:GDP-D-mannose 3', 5'-epimerase
VQISGKPIMIEYDGEKREGDKARSADYSNANKILSWEPSVSLDNGLAEMYEWIENSMTRA